MRSGSPAEQRLLRAAVRILCDYLAVHGFLRKDGTRYRLTPSTSIFLTTTSPAWMGSVVDFLASPEMMNLWGEDPVGFVRNGGSVGLGSVAPDHPMWVTFAKAMVPFMAPVAHGVVAEVTKWPTAPKRILDIAAGHGMFGIALAQALPELRSPPSTGSTCWRLLGRTRKERASLIATRPFREMLLRSSGVLHTISSCSRTSSTISTMRPANSAAESAQQPRCWRARARGRVRPERRSSLSAIPSHVLLHDARLNSKGRRLHRTRVRADGPGGWVPRGIVRVTAAHAADRGEVRVILSSPLPIGAQDALQPRECLPAVPEPPTPKTPRTAIVANLAPIPGVGGWSEPGRTGLGSAMRAALWSLQRSR